MPGSLSEVIRLAPGFWSRLLTGSADVTTDGRLQMRLESEFLPDFCAGNLVLNLIILAQFIAIVVTILSQPLSGNAFQDLMLISIFIHWITLGSIAILCISRNRLNRLPPQRATLMTFFILLCVTFAVSEMALWVMFAFG